MIMVLQEVVRLSNLRTRDLRLKDLRRLNDGRPLIISKATSISFWQENSKLLRQDLMRWNKEVFGDVKEKKKKKRNSSWMLSLDLINRRTIGHSLLRRETRFC